ncbi:hypothetical protein QCA50_013513 [Cerrena zonata]|uniref:F-box domain-containing protein n=1 Tax=Cerrena zonata TaxID=2478898 RepID=A0AAW0G0U6_9APHY
MVSDGRDVYCHVLPIIPNTTRHVVYNRHILQSIDITLWSTGDSSYSEGPETSESRSAASDNNIAAFSGNEWSDDTCCTQNIDTQLANYSALLDIDSKKRAYDRLLGIPESETVAYERRTKRCTYSGRWDDDAATGDRHISPLSPPDLSLYDVDVKMQDAINGYFTTTVGETVFRNDISCNTQKTSPKLREVLAPAVSDPREKAHNGILHSRKPSSLQTGDCSGNLPMEIYEIIIDYVAEVSDFDRRSALARCARVCRAWVPRAQMHLFSSIVPYFPYKDRQLVGVQDAVRRKPFLLQYIKSFNAAYDEMPRPTTLLTAYHMRSLKQWTISRLDLSTTHPSLSKFASSTTSLHLLQLLCCKTKNINHLCRFLTSFGSLSILVLSWSNSMPFHGHDLPHLQFSRSKSSLRTLAIQFTPNISLLLQSFTRACPFVARLKRLIFSWNPRYDGTPVSSPVPEITELLWHCSQSIEEVAVILGGFWVSFDAPGRML